MRKHVFKVRHMRSGLEGVCKASDLRPGGYSEGLLKAVTAAKHPHIIELFEIVNDPTNALQYSIMSAGETDLNLLAIRSFGRCLAVL